MNRFCLLNSLLFQDSSVEDDEEIDEERMQ
jgi:hypothetical protein